MFPFDDKTVLKYGFSVFLQPKALLFALINQQQSWAFAR